MENPKPQKKILTKKAKSYEYTRKWREESQKGTSEGSSENITFVKCIGWLSRKPKNEEKCLQSLVIRLQEYVLKQQRKEKNFKL